MSSSFYKKIKDSSFFKSFMEDVRKQNSIRGEILKGMYFNSTVADSEWFKYKNVCPGEWAADYGLLYTIYRALNSMKPKSIVEFGLGQSSKLIHQYANYFGAEAVTFEHDRQWVDFFNEGRDGKYDIRVELVDLETVSYKGFETVTYKDIDNILRGRKFDFVLVDGPFGSDHYSRSEVIGIARNNLAGSFCIIMDDTDRHEEEETALEVMDVLRQQSVEFCTVTHSALKKHTIICSADMKFLTTL